MPRIKQLRPWDPADPDLAALRALVREQRLHVWLDPGARRRGTPHVVLQSRSRQIEVGRFASCASALRWLRGAMIDRAFDCLRGRD